MSYNNPVYLAGLALLPLRGPLGLEINTERKANVGVRVLQQFILG